MLHITAARSKIQESAGLFGGKKRITYDYEIQITNNRKTEESITILDQLPIVMNENIKVELITPEKKIEELDNEKKLEWKVKLNPGEKKIIPIKYIVEFPGNIIVYGLD